MTLNGSQEMLAVSALRRLLLQHELPIMGSLPPLPPVTAISFLPSLPQGAAACCHLPFWHPCWQCLERQHGPAVKTSVFHSSKAHSCFSLKFIPVILHPLTELYKLPAVPCRGEAVLDLSNLRVDLHEDFEPFHLLAPWFQDNLLEISCEQKALDKKTCLFKILF